MTPHDLAIEGPHLADLDELREVWDTFCARHPDLGAQLAARRAQAKTLRPASRPAVRGPKVGRNDPCPCGSGRKSKKCCGQ